MNMTPVKYIKDGMVAVLRTCDYGGGWYSWHQRKELLFDREIVEAVLNDNCELAKEIAERKYPGGYYESAANLTVEWLPEGCCFEIKCFDGKESIDIISYNALVT